MARRKAPVIPDALLDQLPGGVDARSAFDGGGRIGQLKKALAERAAERGEGSSSLKRRVQRQPPQWLWKENGSDGGWFAGIVDTA